MEPLLVSLSLSALAELADRSQIAVVFMALRWGRFWPVLIGVVLASLINHIGSLGALPVINLFEPSAGLKLALGFGYGLLAVTTWVIERLRQIEAAPPFLGIAYQTTLFFAFAETGDQSQAAFRSLTQQYGATFSVHIGSAIGITLTACVAAGLAARLLQRLPSLAKRYCIPVGFLALALLIVSK